LQFSANVLIYLERFSASFAANPLPQREKSLLHELQSAIALQTFDIEYQPIVAADGGAMVGVEALLRWTHPIRGPIAPSVFIPLAEQSGLMSQLGEIVLRRALSDGARWPTLSVAVNLSPLQIRDRWLVELVANIMAETGIDASRVVLEVAATSAPPRPGRSSISADARPSGRLRVRRVQAPLSRC
jgi:EAL domain-containing protein (putative c-di-GMP-specific phosphodiesterase class I)